MKKEEEKFLNYFKKEKGNKKRYLKKGLEKVLIFINTIIFCFVAMINDFDFLGFIILIGLLIVFIVNALIINKWGRLLKDDELETI